MAKILQYLAGAKGVHLIEEGLNRRRQQDDQDHDFAMINRELGPRIGENSPRRATPK